MPLRDDHPREDMTMPDDFLGLPMRPAKPRERGWTHVIDKGLSLA